MEIDGLPGREAVLDFESPLTLPAKQVGGQDVNGTGALVKTTIHLVCNSHLDPVWLWSWEDGLTETLSTFRIACDLCESTEDFIFCHNEAVLYKWVEEHDPTLFRRIQGLVRAGRWHIAGGSYIQPDVNLPSGESHIRQFLLGKEYFRKAFGVEPTTAYNFDSFGHPEGYIHILAGCGFDSYIFLRPHDCLLSLPPGAFRWRHRSGQQILAWRSNISYLTRGNAYEKLVSDLPSYEGMHETLLLWGLGNHGGGPSRADFEQLRKFAVDHPEYEVIDSTPEAFFAGIKGRKNLPEYRGELQFVFPGCYTSMSRVKQANRACEALMASTERLATMAWWQGKNDYPEAELHEAWEDLLFNQFHDILPGSCIPQGEKDALAAFGHCSTILRRVRLRSFLSLLREEPACEPGTVPLFVWNPHSFAVKANVECEFNFSNEPAELGSIELEINDAETGQSIPFQVEQPDCCLNYDWRMKTILALSMQPYEMRRLVARWKKRPVSRPWKLLPLPKPLSFSTGNTVFTLNPETGFLNFAGTGKENLLGGDALCPIVWEDMPDSWRCGDPTGPIPKKSFDHDSAPWVRQRGSFRLATPQQTREILSPSHQFPRTTEIAPIRIVEQGSIRTIVEAIFVWNRSVLVRRYIFAQGVEGVEVHDLVYWNERDAMLKLAIPAAFPLGDTIAETPYSAVTREIPVTHSEQVSQTWMALRENKSGAGRKKFIAVLNTGASAYSVADGTLHLSLLRSPPYATEWHHPSEAREYRYRSRLDQGEHEFRYRLLAGTGFQEIDIFRQAALLNISPVWYIHYPDGAAYKKKRPQNQTAERSFIEVSAPNVTVVALKKQENGSGLVVRLFEQGGKDTEARLRVAGSRDEVKISIPAHGLKTLLLHRQGRKLRATEVNLIERLDGDFTSPPADI